MASTDDAGSATPYDLVGIGFGPSNLGLAIAVEAHNASVPAERRLTVRFLERQETFGWHRGMLIDGAKMQVSFLKDLVTLRDPTSPYSFLQYLTECGRLPDFINGQTFFPTRAEFHEYLSWAAARVGVPVDYGTEVDEVVSGAPAAPGGEPVLEVVARQGGRTIRLRARNVVVAAGLVPNLPEGVTLGERVWHNADIVDRVAAWTGAPPRRCTVVGAGQSAAESVEYLHRCFPTAEICAVFARYGYSPADDTSFANRVFDPAAAVEFYAAPEETKQLIMRYHRNTNYSSVDPDLIRSLYEQHYAERVAGRERLRFHNLSTVESVEQRPDGVTVRVHCMADGSTPVLDSDVLVYATGYGCADPGRFLRTLVPARDEAGRLQITRDYRLHLTGLAPDGVDADRGPAVYVQGATEHSHGIASILLSNVAVRSGDILGSILARTAERAPALSAS